MKPSKTLIIDNYDSFTFNLYQYVAELGGNPIVVKNNEIKIGDISHMNPTHIIISPGPGHPARRQDFGICSDIIGQYHAKIPILGVCLGHQGIAHHFGARIIHAPEPFHGKTSQIIQTQPSRLFRNLPYECTAMRYHSLIIDESSLPHTLRVTARTKDDNLIMAIEHCDYPLFGLQFHPESIATPQGKNLLRNFLTPKRKRRGTHTRKHTSLTRRLPRETHLTAELNELQ